MATLINSAPSGGSGSMTLQGPATNSNQTLTIPDVTGTVVVSGQNSALTLGTAQATTSGTAINFTSIPSWVKRITVMFNAVSTNGTSIAVVRIGAGSVDATGYLGSGAQFVDAASNNLSTETTGYQIRNANAANNLNGAITLTLFGSNTWVAHGGLSSSIAGYAFFITGTKVLSGTLDRLQLTTVGGTDTFDAGSINIMYE
jgi:hypothetical protein